jgi:ATP-GRASP peptide maturase of grasp-with-spasm system
MNIIFSEIEDQSTNYIIDWFLYYNVNYFRDNGNDEESSFFDLNKFDYHLDINNGTYFVRNENEFIQEGRRVNSVWYRRYYNGVADFNLKQGIAKNKAIPLEMFKNNLKHHNLKFKNLILEFLNKNSKIIGSYDNNNLNKGIVLVEAKKVGFTIPNSIITNSKKELSIFFSNNNNKIITKSLYEVIVFASKNFSNISLTSLITDLKKIPDEFSPSLFQSYIEKEYEIRTFYLHGDCFSMAIFSQNNSKTRVDFRNYDNEKMNRMVPFKLHKSVELKIKKLMKTLNLNTGSIDLMKSADGKYYFLEINPSGQFDFVSKSCNYNLELKIAKYLMNE